MGLAFWKGKIELILEKHSYSAGETIKGDIHLKLKKPIKARKIEIRLLGQEKITTRHVSSGGGYHTRTHTYTICDVKIPLDGEKEYMKEDYNFELPIPPDVLNVSARPDGALGNVIKAAEYLSGRHRRLVFNVIANLDIPMGLDVSKKQNIVIN
jgi:hypothetical protein